jgi:hypothetical protein
MSISELVKHLQVMEDRISENVESLKINPQTFRNYYMMFFSLPTPQ